MFFVSPIFHHISLTICYPDIVFWSPHFDMVCMKIAIYCNLASIFSPTYTHITVNVHLLISNTKLTMLCHFSSSVVSLYLAEDMQDKTKLNLHCLESCPSHDQSRIFFSHVCHAIPLRYAKVPCNDSICCHHQWQIIPQWSDEPTGTTSGKALFVRRRSF